MYVTSGDIIQGGKLGNVGASLSFWLKDWRPQLQDFETHPHIWYPMSNHLAGSRRLEICGADTHQRVGEKPTSAARI